MYKKRGSAIVLVLFAVIVLMMTGVAMLHLSQHAQVQAVEVNHVLAARVAADAGMTMAVHQMNLKLREEDWDEVTLPVEQMVSLDNSGTMYSYWVTLDSGGVYIIESTGYSGNTVKRLSASLKKQSQGPFDQAILALESIEIKNDTLILGYDSSDLSATGLTGDIGTISIAEDAILIGQSSLVTGDVFVGVDGQPEVVIENKGTIQGQQYAIEEVPQLTEITVPDLTDKHQDIVLNSSQVLWPTDSGKYENMELNNMTTLTIDGGPVVLHFTGNVTFRNNASIQVLDGASLVLYVDGDFQARNGSGFAVESKVPEDIQLIATGNSSQYFELKNNGDLYMILYAPTADFTLKNNGDLYGSFVSRSFTLKNNATVYYDYNAQSLSYGQQNNEFVINRWWE